MKLNNLRKIALVTFAAAIAVFAFACSTSTAVNRSATNTTAPQNSVNSGASSDPVKPPTMTDVPIGNAKTPSEAYRMLFAAVKSQDTSKIRTMMSKASLGLAEMASQQQNKPIEEVLKNGFSETTFSETMPQMRDERVKGGYGAVEVWNVERKTFDDVPFVLEAGMWKVAFGDLFGGKFVSPGKSQTIIEQEAANAKNPNLVPVGNINGKPNGKNIPRPNKQ